MENHKDYETLAENLCDIHFLYSKDLSNVFEQHSTRGEEAALFWLSKLENPVSAGELASKLGITSGRIANILSSLDRKKFIERHRSSRDRRQINVALTEAGAAHIHTVYESAKENHISLLEKMGDENANEFIRLMNLAIRTASEMAGA
jgi:DNA-binding MarR family transcriptional regulator